MRPFLLSCKLVVMLNRVKHLLAAMQIDMQSLNRSFAIAPDDKL